MNTRILLWYSFKPIVKWYQLSVLPRKINVLSSSQIYFSWKLWKDSAFLKNGNHFFPTKVGARIFILYKQELCFHWIFELASADIQKCNQLLNILYLTNLGRAQSSDSLFFMTLTIVSGGIHLADGQAGGSKDGFAFIPDTVVAMAGMLPPS